VEHRDDGRESTDLPRVLFIAGYLRSGSTLLERLLGQVDGITAAGELRYVWTNGFKLNQACGCGRPFRSCVFWTRVADQAFGGFDRVDTDQMVTLQRSVDRLWRIPSMTTEFRLPGYRRILDEYVLNLGRLLHALQMVSGCRVLVDSSKAPSHGFLLRSVPRIYVDVVHLVRDSRAVAHSWSRLKRVPGAARGVTHMPRYGPARAALEWDVMNMAANALRLGAGRYIRMRYEELAEDPRGEISRVISAIGEPVGPLDFLNEDGATLGPDHTVSGNPMRFQTGQVRIRPDVAWQTEMSARRRQLVTALTWPLLRAYAYGSFSCYGDEPEVEERP
jgi:hypothetical protein